MKQIDFIEEMNAMIDQIDIMILDNDPAYLNWLESQYETGSEFDR
jgi:hypothetical protein